MHALAALAPRCPRRRSPWLQFSGTPLQLARNFAVMTGVNAGLHAIIKHARGGKDDVKTLMGASFGSGAAFSLVSGLSQGNKLTGAATMGVSFALIQGLFYQIGQAIGGGNNDDDSEYDATRAMLFALDLSKYEKNFKKNQLNDRTLTLLTEETLKDSKVPPGPRLLILDHVANTDYSYLKLAVPPPPPPGSATAGAAPTKGAAPALPGLASAY